MNVFEGIIVGFAAVSALCVLIFAAKTKRFVKTLVCSAAAGLATLLIMYFTAPLTGFRLELTAYTLGSASILGLPGVLGMTIIKMLLI